MSQTTKTKLEWKAQTHHRVNTKNGKCNVIDLNGPMFLVVDGVNNFREQQRIATLIAAAPEMLDALIDARSLLETIDGLEASEACIQLSAALDKTRGKI